MYKLSVLSAPGPDIYVVNQHATNHVDGFVPPDGITPLYSQPDLQANLDSLAEKLDEGGPRRVHVKGGDGTVSWVLQAAVQSGKEIEIDLEENGNKNDLAAMVAAAGGRVALQPMLLEKQQVDGTWGLERVVAYSFGLGAIAVGAKIANSREFRAKNRTWLGGKIAEVGLVRRLLRRETEIDGEKFATHAVVNGRRIGGLVVSNGELMAGGAMRFWQKLKAPGFVTSTVGDGRLNKIAGMASRRLGVHAKDRWTVGAGDAFTLDGQQTLAQADGEDFRLAGGTYRMRQAHDSTVTLTTASSSNNK